MMTTYVYLRYSDPEGLRTKRNWSLRTSYPEHPDQVVKRMVPLIGEEYRDAGDDAVPVGMLLVYFASGKEIGEGGAQNMPEAFEFEIRRHLPEIMPKHD